MRSRSRTGESPHIILTHDLVSSSRTQHASRHGSPSLHVAGATPPEYVHAHSSPALWGHATSRLPSDVKSATLVQPRRSLRASSGAVMISLSVAGVPGECKRIASGLRAGYMRVTRASY